MKYSLGEHKRLLSKSSKDPTDTKLLLLYSVKAIYVKLKFYVLTRIVFLTFLLSSIKTVSESSVNAQNIHLCLIKKRKKVSLVI